MEKALGLYLAQKRKELGYTQKNLADKLNVSFQAISKWENGNTTPDITLLPQIAYVLNTSVDALVGYNRTAQTVYEEKYNQEDYYWGIAPNKLCYEIMKLKPPVKPYRVLDIGCGEGKDAVFLAKNGYIVSAFDMADAGLKKAKELAERNHVSIDFFHGDINDYTPHAQFDIVFSSGVFHYLATSQRKKLIDALKEHTAPNGIHAINVFVKKPFIAVAPDSEDTERQREPWHTGELPGYYHDWLFHKNEEIIFDCNSSGVPHKHCMDIIVAEKYV